MDITDAPIRPADKVDGLRVAFRSEVGESRGWRASGSPTQGRDVAGFTDSNPHDWFLLLVDEDAWFRRKYQGGRLAKDEAMWVRLDLVFTD